MKDEAVEKEPSVAWQRWAFAGRMQLITEAEDTETGEAIQVDTIVAWMLLEAQL